MRSGAVELGASRASVSGLMATSTQQRPPQRPRPRSARPWGRGETAGRRAGRHYTSRLCGEASAPPGRAQGRNPERRSARRGLAGAGRQALRARGTMRKSLNFCAVIRAGALIAPHRPDDSRKSPAFTSSAQSTDNVMRGSSARSSTLRGRAHLHRADNPAGGHSLPLMARVEGRLRVSMTVSSILL